MKKLFINRTHGCETPEEKAESLRRHAHLVSIMQADDGRVLKYYSLAPLDIHDTAVEVTYINGRVVSVRNISSNILSALPPVKAPVFGNF